MSMCSRKSRFGMHRLLFSAVLILGSSTASLADGAPQVDCDNAQTQMEMTYCAEQDWNVADEALNRAYIAAMAIMKEADDRMHADGDMKAQGTRYLREAQRAWIPFRDNACAAEGYQAHGGSMEPMLIYACRAELTRRRTKDLMNIVEGLGN